nr:hypothetical protein [uncultured Romboutsia sp.]
MKLRLFSIGLLTSMSLFMFGCSKDVSTKEITIQDLEKKMSEASYSSEENPIERTMDESLEYVKSVLPEGIEEKDRTYEPEVGVTEVTYTVDEFEFEVRYMHPHKKVDGGIWLDEYDLNNTAGIYFTLK